VLLAVVVVGEILGPRWPPAIAPLLFAAGVVLVAAGILLFVAGILALGPSLTPLPLPKERASLREGGAYGLVRHPIYGGVVLMVAGWSLIATPVGLAMTALVGVFFELKSRREEGWLLARYADYEGYCRRVRWKFLPGIR
jgi:protein-S-isoprenylcysteine O-methyltransferase Ste14